MRATMKFGLAAVLLLGSVTVASADQSDFALFDGSNPANQPNSGAVCSAHGAFTYHVAVANWGAAGEVRITYKDGDIIRFPIAAGASFAFSQAGGSKGSKDNEDNEGNKEKKVAPTGTINNAMPTYTWNAMTGATWYYLWVNRASTPVITQWYTAAQANCPAGTDTCSVTPGTALANGAHTWWIQPYGAGGYGPWSSGLAFTVSPAPAAGGPDSAIRVSNGGSAAQLAGSMSAIGEGKPKCVSCDAPGEGGVGDEGCDAIVPN